MQKMWNFSTLQRPTQEEKERRRKYRQDKIHHANTLLPKSKVGRAKTFRERNNNEEDFMHPEFDPGPASLPVSASMVEVLRHRAKSATRLEHNNDLKKRHREHSAHTGFVSRLRFLDPSGPGTTEVQTPKIRWQDREPSSGYSSGGRGGQDHGEGTSDDNIYGLKFASMPPEVYMTSSRNAYKG